MDVLPRSGRFLRSRAWWAMSGCALILADPSAQASAGDAAASASAASRSERDVRRGAEQGEVDERPVEQADERRLIEIGSGLYVTASNATDQPRFDPLSSLLVNTIGAKTGLFGAAAREGLTWANRYVPGTDVTDVVQLYSLSTSGNYGAFFGARSSDNSRAGAQNVIGNVSLVVADGDRPHLHWAHYSEGYVPRGKTAFRLLINDENSIQNEGNPAPTADPYDFNPEQLLNNLRVDCGIGLKDARSCTNPISILSNGARYRTGMIFGDQSIELVDGVASAISMPIDYGLSWFSAKSTPTWQIYSTARRARAGQIVMTDDAVAFDFGQDTTSAVRIENGAVRSPAIITKGPVPTIGGTCAVRDQLGGATAGRFAFTKDCFKGTIVIGFTAKAPNGWSCFATDMARGNAMLREVAYDEMSATLEVINVQASDAVVFSCAGF